MTIQDRSHRRIARTAGAALAGVFIAVAMPAEARLSDPGMGGPMSGGFFQGLPVRAQAAAARPGESELTGVAGGNCYVLRQVIRDRLGASSLRTVRVCE
jgi:hypothetical protein